MSADSNSGAVNVQSFGVVNASAIQSAIDSLSNVGGEVYIPAGTYNLENTIIIKPKVHLRLSAGAVLKPMTDFHVIRLLRDARISGGQINVSNVTEFKSSCIWLEGVDKFGTTGHNSSISSMLLINSNNSGYGIFFHAKGDGNCISWVHTRDIVINKFEKGIFLHCEYAGDGTTQWVNGNLFSKVSFGGNLWDIYLDGNMGVPYETSGNIFSDIQSQPVESSKFFYVSGKFNRISGQFWDTNLIASGVKGIFSENSSYNLVDSDLSPQQISDLGKGFNEVRSPQREFVTGVFPPATDGGDVFSGNQDDFLAFADKRFSVSQISGPPLKGGALSRMFNLNGDQSAIWDGTQATSTNPVVIELDFQTTVTYFFNVGLSFGPWSECPTAIKVERNYQGSWTTIVDHSDLGVQRHFIQRQITTYVDKLKITFSGTNDPINHNIRVIRLFGQSSAFQGYAYLPMDGGTLYGNLNMGQALFTVGSVSTLPSPSASNNNSVIVVKGNGTTTADVVYICLKSAAGTFEWKPLISG